MAIIKPPITNNLEVDSWTFYVTNQLENNDSILSSFNIKSWIIEEDGDGNLKFYRNNVLLMQLDYDGDLHIKTGKSFLSDL